MVAADCVVGSASSIEAVATFDSVVIVDFGYEKELYQDRQDPRPRTLTALGVKCRLLRASSL